MAVPTQKLVTPKGELAWVFITGKGKKDLNGNDRYVASIRLKKDSPEHKQIEEEINAFWEENKGKGWKQKSNGIKEEVYPENHEEAGEPTGYVLVNFWTGIEFPDGSPKKVVTKTAKNVEVDLKGRKIGNGSEGRISGVMGLFDQGISARGVTLYLNSIQITKFVEFNQDDGFEEEDGFDGSELDEDGFSAESTSSDDEEKPAKVKL